MIFTPTDFGTFLRGAQSFATTPTERAWEAKVQLTNARAKRTWVVIGQSNKATLGFDAKYDSELPPLVGGLQAQIASAKPMFKDIGLWGSVQKFTVKVGGLYIGERCVLDVVMTKGNKMMTLIDKATGRHIRLSQGGRYFFKAAGTTQTFEIWTDLR